MNRAIRALTRDGLIKHLAAMPPNARGRRELERLLMSMTNAALLSRRVRVKAPTRAAVMAGRA